MDQRDHGRPADPTWCQKRARVDLVYDHVVLVRGLIGPEAASRPVDADAATPPDDFDARDGLPARSTRDGRGEERHRMPAFDKSTRNFLCEDLGAARERVRAVLPVEDEDAQRQKPGSAASGSPCN
jgi:hypothetical protein